MGATYIPYKKNSLYAIIPSDSATFDPPLSAVFVGGATGNVAIVHGAVSAAGVVTQASTTYSSVAAGATISGIGPITQVKSTGTTATGLIGVQ